MPSVIEIILSIWNTLYIESEFPGIPLKLSKTLRPLRGPKTSKTSNLEDLEDLEVWGVYRCRLSTYHLLAIQAVLCPTIYSIVQFIHSKNRYGSQSSTSLSHSVAGSGQVRFFQLKNDDRGP